MTYPVAHGSWSTDGELRRHFRDHGWAVHVPRRLQELQSEVERTRRRLEQRLARTPTVAELADEIGMRFVDERSQSDIGVEIDLLAVYAFPLRLRDDCIGALNLYRDEVGEFHDEDLRLAQAFADVAAIGILQERKLSHAKRRADQLQGALDGRVVIEQAKGMLAERLLVSPGEAFERMRSYARSHRESLRTICLRIIDEGFVPE